MRPVCYLDLDGVLVDFVGGALRRHGRGLEPSEVRWGFPSQIGFGGVDDPAFWAPLGRAFWAGLDWTHEGKGLLAAVESLFGDRVALMTSPCETEGCVEGKRDWVRRHLPGYQRRTFVGGAKHLAAGPGKLLIDDREENVDAFAAEGGHALLVPRPWNRHRERTDASGRFDLAALAGGVRGAYEVLAWGKEVDIRG